MQGIACRFFYSNVSSIFFNRIIPRDTTTMLSVDFHSHSLFSKCGLHTIVEMLTEAKARGLAALAVTDHGPELKGGPPTTFWDRLFDPVQGIRMLKGLECNIIADDGTIDFPQQMLKYADIVLLGLHPHLPAGKPPGHNTALLMRALVKNPFVDIVTHPEGLQYPVDFKTLAVFAREHGLALECNNSKVLNNRVPPERMAEYLDACKRAGCRIAVNSDAHALGEVGLDESVRPLLEMVGFPKNLIVNETVESAFAFLEERRKVKKDFLARN
jgi:putative hydrolase